MSRAVGPRLALVSAPSTPTAKLSVTTTPTQTPSPGTWRHPRYDEIARRQKAVTFDASNIQRVVFNVLALMSTWAVGWAADQGPTIKAMIIRPIGNEYASWLVSLIRLALLYNIYAALRPLCRSEDPVSDIPLTPTQRSLLGLDPRVSSSNTPTSSPGTSPFITPPRYRRSITPRSGASGSRSPASNSASPLARKASMSSMRQNGSPSPSTPSALWRKNLADSRDLSRRHSYGSPSPLGPGTPGKDLSSMGFPAMPSPTTGRGASVALNNKWLYEKGRPSPGRSLFS